MGMHAAALVVLAAVLYPGCPQEPPAAVDEIRIHGPTPKDLVQRFAEAHLAAFTQCDPRYRGVLAIAFTIQPSDMLTDLTVRARPPNRAVARCVRRRFAAMRIPHEAGISLVTLKIHLRPPP